MKPMAEKYVGFHGIKIVFDDSKLTYFKNSFLWNLQIIIKNSTEQNWHFPAVLMKNQAKNVFLTSMKFKRLPGHNIIGTPVHFHLDSFSEMYLSISVRELQHFYLWSKRFLLWKVLWPLSFFSHEIYRAENLNDRSITKVESNLLSTLRSDW